ncbi:MAG: carboxypeptidase-like regulatory domain-containing protein [Planctomyces sp.]|jgi:hypothetical protein
MWTRTASIAACFGILLSSQMNAANAAGKSVIRDVELSEDGVLHGHVFSSEGAAVPEKKVAVNFRGKAVARAVTSEDGRFAVAGVRGGAHDIAVGDQVFSVRVWKNGTAPKSASPALVLTDKSGIVRGQGMDQFGNPIGPTSGLGLLDVVTVGSLAAGGAGVYYGVENNNELGDLKVQLQQLASP